MKIKFIAVSLIIAVTICRPLLFGQSTDAVKQAERSNDRKSDEKMVNEEDANFLVRAANARMSDLQQGQMASEKGSSELIKNYGKQMMKDQQMLLTEIKLLASNKNITLPDKISNDKAQGRKALLSETGREFDEKFIEAMIANHDQDIRNFEEATHSADMKISQFAEKYLPLIESHLERIIAIGDQIK